MAPREIIEGLRTVDRGADLAYLGAGRWLLVVKKPHNSIRQQGAATMLDALTAELRNGTEKSTAQIKQRARYALLAYYGYSPVAQYDVQGSPDSAIVDDFRRRDWLYRTTSDDALFRAIDAPQQAAIAQARADMQDPARHRDAYRHAFKAPVSVIQGDNRSLFRKPSTPPLAA